jgi:hypothetical protein
MDLKKLSDLDLNSDVIKIVKIRAKWLPFYSIVTIYTQKGLKSYRWNYLIAKEDIKFWHKRKGKF